MELRACATGEAARAVKSAVRNKPIAARPGDALDTTAEAPASRLLAKGKALLFFKNTIAPAPARSKRIYLVLGRGSNILDPLSGPTDQSRRFTSRNPPGLRGSQFGRGAGRMLDAALSARDCWRHQQGRLVLRHRL